MLKRSVGGIEFVLPRDDVLKLSTRSLNEQGGEKTFTSYAGEFVRKRSNRRKKGRKKRSSDGFAILSAEFDTAQKWSDKSHSRYRLVSTFVNHRRNTSQPTLRTLARRRGRSRSVGVVSLYFGNSVANTQLPIDPYFVSNATFSCCRIFYLKKKNVHRYKSNVRGVIRFHFNKSK